MAEHFDTFQQPSGMMARQEDGHYNEVNYEGVAIQASQFNIMDDPVSRYRPTQGPRLDSSHLVQAELHAPKQMTTTILSYSSERPPIAVVFEHPQFYPRGANGRFLCAFRKPCSGTFERMASVDRHIKTVHLEIMEYQCETCGATFTDKRRRDGHITNTNPRFKKCYAAYKSGRILTSKQLLARDKAQATLSSTVSRAQRATPPTQPSFPNFHTPSASLEYKELSLEEIQLKYPHKLFENRRMFSTPQLELRSDQLNFGHNSDQFVLGGHDGQASSSSFPYPSMNTTGFDAQDSFRLDVSDTASTLNVNESSTLQIQSGHVVVAPSFPAPPFGPFLDPSGFGSYSNQSSFIAPPPLQPSGIGFDSSYDMNTSQVHANMPMSFYLAIGVNDHRYFGASPEEFLNPQMAWVPEEHYQGHNNSNEPGSLESEMVTSPEWDHDATDYLRLG